MYQSADTYRRLIRVLRLNLFAKCQYSDYVRPATDAIQTWFVMCNLFNIRPAGKLESTIKQLKMHHFPNYGVMEVTNDFQLGGQHAMILRGPTLAARVPPGIAGAIPPPGTPGIPPVATRHSVNALNRNHYRI